MGIKYGEGITLQQLEKALKHLKSVLKSQIVSFEVRAKCPDRYTRGGLKLWAVVMIEAQSGNDPCRVITIVK